MTNAAISAGRGDWVGAGLTLAGVIPIVGDSFKAAKYARYADEVVDVARGTRRATQNTTTQIGKYITNIGVGTNITIGDINRSGSIPKTSDLLDLPRCIIVCGDNQVVQVGKYNTNIGVGNNVHIGDIGGSAPLSLPQCVIIVCGNNNVVQVGKYNTNIAEANNLTIGDIGRSSDNVIGSSPTIINLGSGNIIQVGKYNTNVGTANGVSIGDF